MKNFIKGLFIVAAVLIVVPLIPVCISAKYKTAGSGRPVGSDIIEAAATIAVTGEDLQYRYIDSVKVYDIESGKTVDMPIEDYLFEAVLGSISPTAEPELLKAQTVLMYTYILGMRLRAIRSPDSGINGCDISTDSEKYARLVSVEEADKLYLKEVPDYKSKVMNAIESCKGIYLAYGKKPIVPAYCFSAGGVTESAEYVLGEKVPYLVPVKGDYDADYITEAVYSKDELFARLALSDKAFTLLGPCEDWLSISEASETGYVKSILLDGKYEIDGAELARLLSLPSPRFTFKYSEEFDSFTFKVSGAGHLVGLSQYDANEMAKRGADYKQILIKYFVGTKIEESGMAS